MKVIIAAMGKQKQGPEAELFGYYVKRLPWKITLKELEDKKGGAVDERKAREGALLLDAVSGCDRMVALDERGKNLSSMELSQWLEKQMVQGASSLGVVIGGSDGLSDQVRQRASLVLSFGQLTWPHQLARVMLAEQLYRVQSILANHPYHRE